MKRKIAVYAICKNEEAFVSRWFSSMREADEIVVLDTGSEDGTVGALKQLGARVFEKKIVPWRFDHARNEQADNSHDFNPCLYVRFAIRLGLPHLSSLPKPYVFISRMAYRLDVINPNIILILHFRIYKT